MPNAPAFFAHRNSDTRYKRPLLYLHLLHRLVNSPDLLPNLSAEDIEQIAICFTNGLDNTRGFSQTSLNSAVCVMPKL